jgi:parvulin-like peptidyl-prolyl isomerase
LTHWSVKSLANASLTEKGQISQPVKISNGYAIFRLDDIKPSVVKPFDAINADSVFLSILIISFL